MIVSSWKTVRVKMIWGGGDFLSYIHASFLRTMVDAIKNKLIGSAVDYSTTNVLSRNTHYP